MGYYDKPGAFKIRNFMEIPMGSHRVQILNVTREDFKTSKKKCYEITLKVPGQPNLLWYHLWYSPDDVGRTNADFRAFFESFQIKEEDQTLRRYKRWIGKTGAVYVWHNHGPSKRLAADEYEAVVRYCLDVEEQAKLPPWDDVPTNSIKLPYAFSEEIPF